MEDVGKIGRGALRDAAALELLSGLEGSFALAVLDASPDCIKLISCQGALEFMNANGMEIMEIDDFCTVEGKAWPELWPEESRARLTRAVEDATKGRPTTFEAFCPTAKGTPKFWHVSVTPVSDADGQVRQILASSRDITARVEQEQALEERNAALEAQLERTKVLMGEIDHRVKNSFALVSGLLRMQLRKLEHEEARQAVTEAANRIATVARVHEQLHFNPDTRVVPFNPYLSALVKDLGKSLANEGQVTFETQEHFETTAERAISLGLVCAEFVANALEHGGGMVRVGLEKLADPAGWMRLAVRDEGGGLPEGFSLERATGLGMRMAGIYADQLGGILSAGSKDRGAEFSLDFPLEF